MRCRFCLEFKQDSEFYKSDKTGCKDCIRKRVGANRLAKIDYYREYDRMRASMPHRLAQNIAIGRRWRSQHPLRRKAQVVVGNALRDGRLARLPCLICGEKAEAHHTHYDAPLEVVWLCSAHHKQAHAMARAA